MCHHPQAVRCELIEVLGTDDDQIVVGDSRDTFQDLQDTDHGQQNACADGGSCRDSLAYRVLILICHRSAFPSGQRMCHHGTRQR